MAQEAPSVRLTESDRPTLLKKIMNSRLEINSSIIKTICRRIVENSRDCKDTLEIIRRKDEMIRQRAEKMDLEDFRQLSEILTASCEHRDGTNNLIRFCEHSGKLSKPPTTPWPLFDGSGSIPQWFAAMERRFWVYDIEDPYLRTEIAIHSLRGEAASKWESTGKWWWYGELLGWEDFQQVFQTRLDFHEDWFEKHRSRWGRRPAGSHLKVSNAFHAIVLTAPDPKTLGRLWLLHLIESMMSTDEIKFCHFFGRLETAEDLVRKLGRHWELVGPEWKDSSKPKRKEGRGKFQQESQEYCPDDCYHEEWFVKHRRMEGRRPPGTRADAVKAFAAILATAPDRETLGRLWLRDLLVSMTSRAERNFCFQEPVKTALDFLGRFLDFDTDRHASASVATPTPARRSPDVTRPSQGATGFDSELPCRGDLHQRLQKYLPDDFYSQERIEKYQRMYGRRPAGGWPTVVVHEAYRTAPDYATVGRLWVQHLITRWMTKEELNFCFQMPVKTSSDLRDRLDRDHKIQESHRRNSRRKGKRR